MAEKVYIFCITIFKIVFYIIFSLCNYKTTIKISRRLNSKKVFFKSIKFNNAIKINKKFRSFPFKSSCLQNSLFHMIVLSYAGINVDVNAGLKEVNGKIEGHAWITFNGKPIYDGIKTVNEYHITHIIN